MASVPVMRKKRKAAAKLPPYVVIKGGDWHVRRFFPLGDRDERGRPKYIQVTRRCVPETPERAAELAGEIQTAYDETTAGPVRPNTVADFFNYFLERKKAAVARRTYEHDQDLYKRYVAGNGLARRDIRDLSPAYMQDFFDDLIARQVSPIMLQKVRIFLATGFNQALRWKMIDEIPTGGLLLPKVKKTPAPAMTKAEVKRFLEVCRKNDAYLVFEFALATAMRPQEYLALQVSELDLERNRARVVRALAIGFKGGGFEIKDPKTDASFRSIPFGSDLADRLRAHLEKIEKWKKELRAASVKPALLDHMKRKGTNYKKRLQIQKNAREILANLKQYDLVFPSEAGKPASRENLNNREFKAALVAAGIDPKRYSLKSLRTTCLTLLAEKLSPKRLQQFAGHARIETSLNFYVYVDDEDQAAIPDKFEQSLNG